MYAPIWDDGENGTAINDTNYAAVYVYNVALVYKDYVKYWEVWNEPDFGSANGWKPAGMEGNWWENTPELCELPNLFAPVYHYMRFLRISYEVIKSVDPNAFITVGGIGSESFLDVILRYTDNPTDGSVTVDYPLTGGAYFDALSLHSYPHINGSMKHWDNGINDFVYTRNSDAGSDGIVERKNGFQTLLESYGYDDTTYPKKITIMTETNIPNKKMVGYDGVDMIGSYEAQRNYGIKVVVKSYTADIKQLDFFQLGNINSYDASTNWTEVSGLYGRLDSIGPYDQKINEEGTALRTFTDLIWGKTYDEAKTTALNLPPEVDGAAFLGDNGLYAYVLWAKTTGDQTEAAAATFNFPAALGIDSLERREWDFAETQTWSIISPSSDVMKTSTTSADLTGAPSFFQEAPAPLPIELLDFAVTSMNGAALLDWTTSSEKNNRGFEIQHSLDGKIWTAVGFVNGAGDATTEHTYQFRHLPSVGLNFYRLNQVDFDGLSSYSTIKSVLIESEKDHLKVYPSPVNEQLNITNFLGKGYIFSMTGQVIQQFDCTDESKNEIMVHQLPKGTYHLLLVNQQGVRFNQLFVKE